jgi:hypothetical protein
MQRNRHRRRLAQRKPLADFQHAARDMGVLHERELIALDREFRQAVHHRENAMMMPRRNRFQKFRPYAAWRAEGERRRAAAGGHPTLGQREYRQRAFAGDGETGVPRSGPAGQNRVARTGIPPGGGIRKWVHCGSITSSTTG